MRGIYEYGNKYYKSNPRIKYIAYLIGAVIMVTGYFFAKWYMKQSLAIALVTAPENVFQSAVGYVIAILLHPTISSLAEKFRKGKKSRYHILTPYFMPSNHGIGENKVWGISP